MGSDRARVSYDKTRQYRSVVMQQGRVTVEADWNEAQLIATEEERKEALDVVGPAGTQDDGYRVLEPGTVPNPPFDFTVGPGTMFVGGVRAFAPDPIVYSQQSDWLDHSTDPDWVEPAALSNRQAHEDIYLLLREQEVSAVEDTALREVALGGPDTAQRTRLIQHIVRSGTDASTCDDARASLAKHWASEGLTPHYDTMRLLSSATLQVSFPPSDQSPDPCEPPATGGYLGADNQLIRIQISSVDGNGNYRFVWGYDDASFLYRVQPLDSQNLKLQSRPVDQYHRPRAGQAVEVLRSAAALGGDNFIASATGVVSTLTIPYDSDLQTVTLPAGSPLPAAYQSADDNPMVFLRVWEEEKPVVPGTPTDLGKTGMQITLQAAGGIFHVGDFWLIAVRPITPTKVYPQRFYDGPQPPDGPRLWFCPLAVIDWQNGKLHVLEDCRNPFDNLVDLTRRKLGGCCTVIVRSEDLTGGVTLQTVLDKYVHRDKIVVCLMPGVYLLHAPLRLGTEHSNLTLEACHDGAILKAAPGAESKFLDGLVVLNRANNVVLRGLRFDLPQVPFIRAGGKLANLDTAASKEILGSLLEELFVSVGVRPVHCALLTIENCLFRFSLTENKDVFGVGIFASSECWGFRLAGCRFVHEEDFLRNRSRPFRLLVGYMLMPSVSLKSSKGAAARSVLRAGAFSRTILQDARIEENLFSGISIAALITARTGVVAIENNTVRDCYAGFWLLSMPSLAFSTSVNEISVNRTVLETAQGWYAAYASAALDPLIVIGSSIARSYPLPSEFDVSHAIAVEPATASVKETKKKSYLQGVVDKILRIFHPMDAAAKAGAKKARTAAKEKADTVGLADAAKVAIDSGFAADSALRGFLGLHSQLSSYGQSALDKGASVNLELTLIFTSNEVDARISDAASNACLLVIDEDIATVSSLTMNGNILRTYASTAPAAAVILVERCAISGNVIVNEESALQELRPLSLVLFPGGRDNTAATVAVTGNVLQGKAILPDRPVTAPAPMVTWHFFNSES
jgi:hypothetical protein